MAQQRTTSGHASPATEVTLSRQPQVAHCDSINARRGEGPWLRRQRPHRRRRLCSGAVRWSATASRDRRLCSVDEERRNGSGGVALNAGSVVLPGPQDLQVGRALTLDLGDAAVDTAPVLWLLLGPSV